MGGGSNELVIVITIGMNRRYWATKRSRAVWTRWLVCNSGNQLSSGWRFSFFRQVTKKSRPFTCSNGQPDVQIRRWISISSNSSDGIGRYETPPVTSPRPSISSRWNSTVDGVGEGRCGRARVQLIQLMRAVWDEHSSVTSLFKVSSASWINEWPKGRWVIAPIDAPIDATIGATIDATMAAPLQQ